MLTKSNFTEIKIQVDYINNERIGLGKIISPIFENFKLNDQEKLEVCQIGKFVYKIDSKIIILDKPQPPNPDFIIEVDQKIIGLEHTQIVTEDAQRYFRIKKLIEQAEKIFEKKYKNINVLATISINNDEWNYQQKDKQILAELIADCVFNKIKETKIELPEKIRKIETSLHSKVTFIYSEKNWQSKFLTRTRLKEEIEKKENKISNYTAGNYKLNEIWLVLFMGSLSSVSYELCEFENYKIDSKFDSVFLMTDFDAKIIRVK